MTLTYATAKPLVPCAVKVKQHGSPHGIPAQLVGGSEGWALVRLRNHRRPERVPWSRVWLWKSRNPGLAENRQ